MAAFIHVPGLSGSGKTTLIAALVAEFGRRGYRVGVLKHCGHGFDGSPRAKDGARFAEAGARVVVLAGPDSRQTTVYDSAEAAPDVLAAAFPLDLDLVFIEGFKQYRGYPRVEICGGRPERYTLCLPGCRGPEPVATGEAAGLEAEGVVQLADLLEREVVSPVLDAPELSLRVDGRPVPMKGFVRDLLRNVTLGMVGSLKFCDAPRTVELVLREATGRGDEDGAGRPAETAGASGPEGGA